MKAGLDQSEGSLRVGMARHGTFRSTSRLMVLRRLANSGAVERYREGRCLRGSRKGMWHGSLMDSRDG